MANSRLILTAALAALMLGASSFAATAAERAPAKDGIVLAADDSAKGSGKMGEDSGTQSGDVFTLRGKGMPDPHGGRVGDLLVQTYIETPKKLTKRQADLLRELAEIEQVDVTPHRKTFLEKIRDYFAPEGTAETKQEK